jgi:DNA polymerase-3 subunit epsilon
LETATAFHPLSAGIVTVENGVIVDEFVSLIKPPNNLYLLYHLRCMGFIQGIQMNAKLFYSGIPEIQNDYRNRLLYAHK